MTFGKKKRMYTIKTMETHCGNTCLKRFVAFSICFAFLALASTANAAQAAYVCGCDNQQLFPIDNAIHYEAKTSIQ